MTTTETITTNEITFSGEAPPSGPIPPGYSCLHSGDTFKTRRTKRLAAERGLKVLTRMKQSGRFTQAVAYYVPTEVLVAVEAEARATEADRAKARVAGQRARAKAHARELAQVVVLIRDLFPAIPAGGGRAGRGPRLRGRQRAGREGHGPGRRGEGGLRPHGTRPAPAHRLRGTPSGRVAEGGRPASGGRAGRGGSGPVEGATAPGPRRRDQGSAARTRLPCVGQVAQHAHRRLY